MALAMDQQYDPTPLGSSSLADAAKQATKALKCVAFTSKQVGEMLARKHERIMKRIGAISEEIESLKSDVMENITHQRERRSQIAEIEEDIERAQLLGNGTIVEELLDELRVMKDETKREEALYRALCKTVRSRRATKKQFMRERLDVEEEIRNFAAKQKLIQTLLATCSKQSSSSDQEGSSASQSDCGASALEDSSDEDDEENASRDNDSASSGSSGSFPENPFDSPVFRPMDAARQEKVLAKAVSLMEPPTSKRALRVRSWSSDCVQPLPPRESVQNRTRHSLSVHFASPVLTVSTIQTNDEALDKELESLDLAHYLGSIDESAAASSAAVDAPVAVPGSAAAASLVESTAATTDEPEETTTITMSSPLTEQPPATPLASTCTAIVERKEPAPLAA